MTDRLLEELKEDVTEIQKHFGLSDYEALQISLKIRQECLFQDALFDQTDEPFLEEIKTIREHLEYNS